MTERTCHVLLGLVLAIAFGFVLSRVGSEPVADRGQATQETGSLATSHSIGSELRHAES